MPNRPDTPCPKLRSHLLDASGGIGYHLRALAYRRSLWAPFIARVGDWLQAWSPAATHIVIVGASGGYALSADFLRRFEHITILEPDPLARLILRRRFVRVTFDFGQLDCLADHDGPAWLAHRYPDAAVLFANVLGQSPALAANPKWRPILREALRAHHWASWHDILSATQAPLADPDCALEPATTLASLAGRYWRWPTEVCDHDSFGLAGRQDGLALWQLAPAQWQIVEWGTHAP